jgi:hypothetical protein
MKLLSVHLVATLVSVACMNAHAGNKEGNGGNAVVCRNPDGTIKSAELLDLYEARTIRSIEQDPRLETMTRQDLRSTIAEKFSRLDAASSLDLNQMVLEMLTDIEILEITGNKRGEKHVQFIYDNVAKVNDSLEIFIPKSCAIEQFIIQISPEFLEDRRFNFQKDIWSAMDPLNQIASLYHEAILYRAVRISLSKNSVGTRYINSLLFSDKSLTRTDFLRASAKADFLVHPNESEKNKPSTFIWDDWSNVFPISLFVGTDPSFEMGNGLFHLKAEKTYLGRCKVEIYNVRESSTNTFSYYVDLSRVKSAQPHVCSKRRCKHPAPSAGEEFLGGSWVLYVYSASSGLGQYSQAQGWENIKAQLKNGSCD